MGVKKLNVWDLPPHRVSLAVKRDGQWARVSGVKNENQNPGRKCHLCGDAIEVGEYYYQLWTNSDWWVSCTNPDHTREIPLPPTQNSLWQPNYLEEMLQYAESHVIQPEEMKARLPPEEQAKFDVLVGRELGK